ncbi:hypothetical protein ABZT04_08905 [Streptomyces sp. NPDC005492]|uniref:hypothetical protein n=1 Tax=Streptomyces sp. NPDC005492 TaxID=3156883 RepID=UPI0033BD93C4
MIQQRIVLLSAAGLAATFLLAACDSSMDNTSSAPAAVTSVPATSVPATPATASSAPSGATTGLVAEAVKGGGDVVTDDKGMTLYRYDKDEPSPSKWTCSGECTKTWIPVIVRNSVQTTGVEKSLLGTVHRSGQTQLTLGGWPLYRYVGDTAAGQLNGQAKDRMWYAVTPSGQKLTAAG